jgi:hypothetical protein
VSNAGKEKRQGVSWGRISEMSNLRYSKVPFLLTLTLSFGERESQLALFTFLE